MLKILKEIWLVTMKDSRDTRLKVISIMDFRWCTVGYNEGF